MENISNFFVFLAAHLPVNFTLAMKGMIFPSTGFSQERKSID